MKSHPTKTEKEAKCPCKCHQHILYEEPVMKVCDHCRIPVGKSGTDGGVIFHSQTGTPTPKVEENLKNLTHLKEKINSTPTEGEWGEYMQHASSDEKIAYLINEFVEKRCDRVYLRKRLSSLFRQIRQEAIEGEKEKLDKLKKPRFKWDYKEGEGEYKDGYNDAIEDAKKALSVSHPNKRE